MSDIDVDIFLETLKRLIMTCLNHDLISIRKKHQLQSLEAKIKYLRKFLNDTEKKRTENSKVMELVKQVRDVVSKVEDLMELHVVLGLKVDPENLSLDRESIKMEIKVLVFEVKQIYDKNMYDINGVTVKEPKQSSTESGGDSSLSGGSNISKEGEEKVVVGFEEEVKRLMEQLDDNGKSKPLNIISVTGAAGGGKTTLVKEVFDKPWTVQKFEIRAWVVVSQDYSKIMKRDLLISILKSASAKKPEEYEKSSEDELGEMVLKCLKDKKYLIVIDDIWSIEAWIDIQKSFPRESKGSKVLFTSRHPLLQPENNYCIHRLGPLQKSSSWELLEKKVFRKKCCPPELLDVGKQIANKCEGLPLAIVAVAGILATKDKTLDLWQEVAEHLSLIIAKNEEGCMEILELSYNHLPLHLKACFLYIGGFKEDEEIPVKELIWLWIAEGFIRRSEEGKSLEAVAKDYLFGLIDRSLIMVSRKNSLGEIKTCRIHDLLRVLSLKKAEEDNFLVQINGDDSFSSSTYRRLFIADQFFQCSFSNAWARNLRSFISLSLPYSDSFRKFDLFDVENFKLLRVLSTGYPVNIHGEEEIGHPLQLRYLACAFPRYSENKVLPFSNLLNLEILTINSSLRTKEMPLTRDIFKIVKLRHIYSKKSIFTFHDSRHFRGKLDFDNSSKLESLQTLHSICPCEDCLNFLVRTPNLKKLGICGNLIDDQKAHVLMHPDLEFLECLETLKFINSSVRESTSNTLSAGAKFPHSLTRLTLKKTYLKWDELSIILQTLPRLEVLKLLNMACKGDVWDTRKLDEFPQLKYFKLSRVYLKEWYASEEQFPRLEVLVLDRCTSLGQIPINFANPNYLREIKVEFSSCSAAKSAMDIQQVQNGYNGDDGCVNLVMKKNTFYWDEDEQRCRSHHSESH